MLICVADISTKKAGILVNNKTCFKSMQLGMVIHSYSPSTQEAEAGEPQVEGQPGLRQQGTEGRRRIRGGHFPHICYNCDDFQKA